MTRFISLPRLTVLALALGCAIYIPAATAQAKTSAVNIGLVDMERIFGEFYKTKLAEEEVEKVKELIKSEVEERKTTHEKLLQEYEALVKKVQDPTLSEALRKGHKENAEKKAAELRSLDAEMKEYSENRRRQLITQVEGSKAKIITEISAKINELALADGFDAVYDRSALSERGFPIFVFVKDATDLSEKVIAMLNADAPKTATTPPAPKKPAE